MRKMLWKYSYSVPLREAECVTITGINGLKLECRESTGFITGNNRIVCGIKLRIVIAHTAVFK